MVNYEDTFFIFGISLGRSPGTNRREVLVQQRRNGQLKLPAGPAVDVRVRRHLQWVSVETRTRIPFDLDAIAQLRPFESTNTHKAAVPSRKCQSLGIAHVVLKGPPALDLAASLGIRS